jgi:DNA-binding MarR family transcriptional regulator
MDNSDKSLGPRACHCSATRQLARHVTKLYERHLAPVQITGTQFSVLAFLHDAGKMTTSELADALTMDRTTVTRALKPLLSDKLIVSAAVPGERRLLSFSVSPGGLRKLKEAEPLWLAAQEEYETQIGLERARHFRQNFLAMTSQS